MRDLNLAAILTGIGLLGLLVLGSAAGAAADQTQRVYYSIHFASFKSLENANRQVNALQEKGKIVFWKQTDVPEKGMFYRVYLGRYERRADAVAFWEKLNQAGAVSYFGIHEFRETVSVPTLPPTPEGEAEARLPAAPKAKVKGRFIDNLDGTVSDTQTGLMWIKNGWRLDFFASATWDEAQQKCRAFDLGGHKDWRLPTLAEWRSIIDSGNQNPALIEPNPFENIIGHLPYWTETEYTYGRNHTFRTKAPRDFYTVMLFSGSVNHQKKTERAFILPVRTNN